MTFNRRRNLIIIGAVVICLVVVAVFFIFSRGKSADDYVEEYFELLADKEYGKMYAMLSDDGKIEKDAFVERYQNIYEGIEASDFKLTINDSEDDVVDYQLTMNTVA
uniref:NTF2-like N-terminal transpeptidase domain-containing protein n=1 Tax=Thomasclavelia sp. TaxID=3025757 RepID=UPI0025FF2F9E